MSVTGPPGQGPVRVVIPIADRNSGGFLAQGILVALLDREVAGKGRWVHTSLLEAQIAMLDFQATRWTMDGEVPQQAGNDHPTGIPTGVFTTADGHINIAASSQVRWERFCPAAGLAERLSDPESKSHESATKNRHPITHPNATSPPREEERKVG